MKALYIMSEPTQSPHQFVSFNSIPDAKTLLQRLMLKLPGVVHAPHERGISPDWISLDDLDRLQSMDPSWSQKPILLIETIPLLRTLHTIDRNKRDFTQLPITTPRIQWAIRIMNYRAHKNRVSPLEALIEGTPSVIHESNQSFLKDPTFDWAQALPHQVPYTIQDEQLARIAAIRSLWIRSFHTEFVLETVQCVEAASTLFLSLRCRAHQPPPWRTSWQSIPDADLFIKTTLGDSVEWTFGFHENSSKEGPIFATFHRSDSKSQSPVERIPIQLPAPHTNPELEDEITELRRRIRALEQKIRDLLQGGLQQPQSAPKPPSTETLLETFQLRFMEARLTIRRLERTIMSPEIEKLSPSDRTKLQGELDQWIEREHGWIQTLSEILNSDTESPSSE